MLAPSDSFVAPAPAPADPFTDAILRLMPRIRTIAHLRLGRRLRDLASSSDIAQSACRQLLELRGKLEFRGDAALTALIDTVVTRNVRGRARSSRAACRSRQRESTLCDVDEIATGDDPTPIERAIEHERHDLIVFQLEHLPRRDAEGLVLRHVLGLSQEEVASDLGLTLAATRNLLHRARSRLAAALRRSEGATG